MENYKWIDVLEKQPTMYKEVLVYNETNNITVAEFFGIGWEDQRGFQINPTHWMELPIKP